ncbi:DUF5057 domain-containing protein [Saccharibacillus qingshengii]|uniref:DUF5057 domain-containing protein n=1 Tax=Saccharibacillus qingshengii TaxID=1763540 RepID=UPI0015551A02|nr:DUF5057 domain-containing protein [Saccharibacillus qingshengii]
MKKRMMWVWTMLLALVLISVPFGIWKAMASDPPYKIKILEIVDNPKPDGSYSLSSALGVNGNVVVETMRMKKFVALRDELDGKYDAIYFGAEKAENSGFYSTEQPSKFTSQSGDAQSQAHDTTKKMNDITKLKVEEIKKKYISRNLPVIFNTAIADKQPSGELRSFYNTYLTEPASSVSYVGASDSATFRALVSKIKAGDASFKQRPQLEVLSQPTDFIKDPTKIYRPGDTLTFNFNANYVKDFSTPVNVTLYASVDKVLPMTAANVVASKTINQQNGTITYTLPQTFSGPIYWKLVLNANNQSDYVSGAFRVRDQKTTIRVLQVMPSDNASSLRTETNMKQDYLKSDDYDIQITPILFKDFNTESNENSYSKLNGKYDMVIFGFIDNYNSKTSSELTDQTAKYVNDFINTGQAVMFTHDTMIGGNSNAWVKNFQTTTGQTGLYTNLGLGAPNPSTRTKIVNSGMLTQFPFDLSLKPSNDGGFVGQVLQTHDQYYMLNLEDPQVVPWYNIVSEDADTYKRDSDDSYDHYYTYSKGNVTYSGTGHVNKKFPEWEQKLFVNTMFRAFIGSNHAPSIQVITPEASDRTLPSYLSDLSFSYKVNDLDIKDLNLTSSAKIWVNNQERPDLAIAKKTIGKGQVISETFANPLAVDGGKIRIEITAMDEQGAKATQNIDLVIEKKEAILKTSRTINNANAQKTFKVGDSIEIDYKVEAQPIELSKVTTNGTPMPTMELTKVKYTETLPPNLDFPKNPATGLSILPDGVVIDSGDANTGYVISKTFTNPITYVLSDDKKSYKAKSGSDIFFTLTVIPKKTRENPYLLNKAHLSYVDFPQPAADPTSTALKILKDYSLILTGNVASTINGGGPIKGSIISNSDINFTSFAVANQAVISNKSLNFSNPGGGARITNGSIWTTGNLSVGNVGLLDSQLYAVGNLTLGTQTNLNSSNAVFGGTIDIASDRAIKDAPAAIQDKLNERLLSSGINGFPTMIQSFSALSDGYKNMAANGVVEAKWGNLYLTGKDPTMNIFNINTDTTPLAKTNLTVPENSTTIINVSGNNAGFTDGFLTKGTTTQSLLVNYVGTGTFSVSNAVIDGTLLAPTGTVAFTGSNVQGAIVASKITGNVAIYNKTFTGLGPTISSAQPTPGKNQSVIFPPVDFYVPVLVSSIELQDSFIWIKDSLTISAKVLPENALNKTLTWESENPSIVSILKNGPTDRTTTITGISPGTTRIWAIANDGSGIKKSAEVTVAVSPLSIEGSHSVGLNETIDDIRAVVNDDSLELTNIRWTLSGGTETADGNQNSIALLKKPLSEAKVSLSGKKIGSADVQLTATVIKKNKAGNEISRRDWTAPVHTIYVINPLESISVDGPNWIPVTKSGSSTSHSIDLIAKVEPEKAVLKSVLWSVSEGDTSGRLTNTASNGTPLANSLISLDKPGEVVVKVTATAEGAAAPVAPAFKSIRVVDVNIRKVTGKEPETLESLPEQPVVYFNSQLDLKAAFDTYDLNSWTKRPTDYSWTVQNLTKGTDGRWTVDSSSTQPYAQLSDTKNGYATLKPDNGLEGKVRITVTVGGMTSYQDIEVQARLTGLQLPSPITVQEGQSLNLNALLNPAPGVMVGKLPQILPVLDWKSDNPNSAAVGNEKNDKGLVTGVKGGTSTTVTVMYPSPDGSLDNRITATTEIRVTSRNTPVNPTDPTDPGSGPIGDNLF